MASATVVVVLTPVPGLKNSQVSGVSRNTVALATDTAPSTLQVAPPLVVTYSWPLAGFVVPMMAMPGASMSRSLTLPGVPDKDTICDRRTAPAGTLPASGVPVPRMMVPRVGDWLASSTGAASLTPTTFTRLVATALSTAARAPPLSVTCQPMVRLVPGAGGAAPPRERKRTQLNS